VGAVTARAVRPAALGALVLVAAWLPRWRLSPLAGRIPVVVRPEGASDA